MNSNYNQIGALTKQALLATWSLTACFIITVTSCAPPTKSPKLEIKEIEIETQNSGQSRLVVDHQGTAYLSWIEYTDNDTFQLQYARLLENDILSKPIVIAAGDNWFTNWADFPSLAVYNNGHLAAHWLQMSGEGTYDYDVMISQSADGTEWSRPFVLHNDGVAAEHGFATMIPVGEDSMVATWLDGRQTKMNGHSEQDKEQHSHTGGAMTLRTATFDMSGNISNEYELDNRICDCCQTDMALTDQGPVIVYRDRSPREIRDMSIVRKVDSAWTEPSNIYNDEWHINGCPVNGPAVDALGRDVVVAWYTSAHGIPKGQIAYSKDGGANFDLPVQVDDGLPLGRVDVLWYDEDKAIITWLESTGDTAEIRARFISRRGDTSDSQLLVTTDGCRRSGFPIIAKDNKGLLLTWTSIHEDKTKVRSARLTEY